MLHIVTTHAVNQLIKRVQIVRKHMLGSDVKTFYCAGLVDSIGKGCEGYLPTCSGQPVHSMVSGFVIKYNKNRNPMGE